MRISVSMLRRLSAGILVSVIVLLLAAAPVSADTGTYKILDYVVTMEPQNDGRVIMTFEQRWQVLTGSIPWITVGLPNKSFEIQGSSGDVSSISDGSGSGFTGVRLDLKESYQPGETFNISFTVLQGKILERLTDENIWRIAYTPGWYDQAVIDHLQINLISPVDYATYVSVSPMPAVSANVLTWDFTNLSPGERLTVLAASSNGAFLTADEPKTGSSGLGTGFWVFIIILVAVGLMIVWGISQSRKKREEYLRGKAAAIKEEMAKDPAKQKEIDEKFKEYVEKKNLQPDAQGRVYDRSYGGYITPALWWAILYTQRDNLFHTPGQGSSNVNPGCVHSCACVSCACACACACAGGGAAGCSRKTLHEFRTVQRKTETEITR